MVELYQQRTDAQSVMQPARARGVRVSDAVGRGLQNVAQAGMQMADVQARLTQARGEVEAQSEWSDFQIQQETALEQQAREAAPGADGFAKRMAQQYEQQAAATRDRLTNPAARQAFERQALRYKVAYERQARRIETEEMRRYTVGQLDSMAENYAKLYGMHDVPGVVAQAPAHVEAVERTIEASPLSAEDKAVLQDKLRAKVLDAANRAVIDQAPMDYTESIGQPLPAGKAGTLDFILQQEGGLVERDGASGNPALFGINRRSYPDKFREIKALYDAGNEQGAKQAARQFYDTEIWQKHNLSQLPPDVARVVADGLVNHWAGFQQKLLSEARGGAGAAELLELRRKEYDRLAEAAPERYGGSYDGWMNRLQALRGSIALDSARTGNPLFDLGTVEQQQRWRRLAEAEQGRARTRMRQGFERQMKDQIAMAQQGEAVEALAPEVFRGLYGEEQGAQAYDSYRKDLQAAQDYHDAFTMTLPQQQVLLQERKPQRGQSIAEAQRRYEALQQSIAKANEARARDPIAYGIQTGLAQRTEPLQFDDPEALAGDLRYRGDLASVMQASYGTPYQLLSEGEAGQLQGWLQTAQPDAQLQLIEAFQQAAGDRTAEALSQIAEKDQVFAHVGGLVAAAGPGARRTALDVLRGRVTLAQNPKAVQLSGFEAAYRQTVGNAFALMPQNAQALLKSAKSLYVVRALQQGAAEEFDQDVFADAISEALGHPEDEALLDYNDSMLVLPPGVNDGQFQDFIETMTPGDWVMFSEGEIPPTDAMGRTLTPEILQDQARFLTVGTGRYKLQLGDGVVRRGNQDYVLQVTPERVAEVLRR